MKDAYYFPHDSNAIQDPKMMTLLSECGLPGIGMFWILVEILHQQESGKITSQEFRNYLKFYYNANSHGGTGLLDKIEQVLNTSGLLVEQDGFVWSERVLKNKKFRAEISQKRSLAGIKSGEVRARLTSVEQMLNKSELGKERKGKESKGKEINKEQGEKPALLQDRTKTLLKNDYAKTHPGVSPESEAAEIRAKEIIEEVANKKDVKKPVGLARSIARQP